MSKSSKKIELSASAKKVTELIESVSSGNQRKFARLVGCSQPVLSRIVNGKQEPGRDLLERICQLKSVDRKSLLATLKTEAIFNRDSQTMIPIAQCLLDGAPAQNQNLLTGSTVTLSPAIYRQSLYAVRASACEPAFSDASELMRAIDLIIIESSLEWLINKNLQALNGKLCVVIVREKNGDIVTLRRVWTSFDLKNKKWVVCTCSDSKVDKYRQEKHKGRMLRSIQLDSPETHPESESEFIDKVVDVGDIVGIALELIRNL